MPHIALTDPPRLRMQGIARRFGATVALEGVDLSVASGQVLALVGENGAGKSTLMKVLSGAIRPDAGRMWLDGRPYAPRGPHEARRAGVCMIYQELALAPQVSVMENILLGVEPTRGPLMDWPRMRSFAADALRQLGREEIDPGAIVADLGIAERQLVEIARALAVGCRVLVLDEPTSSLGKPDIQRLFALVRRLRGQGLAILYISHFLEEVRQISDRVLVLRDGRTVGEGATADLEDRHIVQWMVGREVQELYPRRARPAGETLLEISDLSGATRPHQADLQLKRGRVLGIAGLVGAGRTELLRAIFGLDPIRRGQVRLGAFHGPAAPRQRWRQGAGLLSEDRKREGLATGLSIADNLLLPGVPGWSRPRHRHQRAARWIDRLGVRCRSADQPVGDLSGGNQQKIALARLLESEVDLLLLDEPTRGIDVASKAEIYRLIDELAGRGKAVLMVSSHLPELLGVCDEIAVMCRGVLGPVRAVEATSEQDIILQATGAGASSQPLETGN